MMETNKGMDYHEEKPKLQRQESFVHRTRLTGKASTRRGKKLQILLARGMFFFLPVRFSNDIVHGSWWYVAGSLVSIPMAIVPLIDVYSPFFEVPAETALPAFGQAASWILLLIMSILYTIGSFILVRAFDEPVPEPYLKDWTHFCTDELLGSWFFLFAAIPSIPFSLVFLGEDPHSMIHWAMFLGSIVLIAISAWFVYVCYPSRHHLMQLSPHVLPIVERLFGKGHWMCRHVDSDWLASTWFFLIGSLIFMFGSFVLIIESKNDRQLFVWITSYFDFMLFAIGSAYLVAGSYTRSDEDIHMDYDKDAENTKGLDDVFNPMFIEEINNNDNSIKSDGSSEFVSIEFTKLQNNNNQKKNLKKEMNSSSNGNNNTTVADRERASKVDDLISKYSRLKNSKDGDENLSNNNTTTNNNNNSNTVSSNNKSSFNSSPQNINNNNNNRSSSNTVNNKPPAVAVAAASSSSSGVNQNKSSSNAGTKKSVTLLTSSSASSTSSAGEGLSSSIDSTSHSSSSPDKPGSSFYVRSSKLRNVYANQPKIETTFHNIRVSNISGDQNFIRCNHLFFAVGIESAGGGAFSVVNLANYRRYDGDMPLITGHSAPILDFDFNPFFPNILATGSEDCKVKIWSIPEGGLQKNMNTSFATLSGHNRKVLNIRYHPTVAHILSSISADGSNKLWNVEQNREYYSVKPLSIDPTSNTFYDMVWNGIGSMMITSMKDKSIHCIDARNSKIPMTILNAHDGGKCIKLISLDDDADRILSVGNTKGSMRQVKIWDPRNASTEVMKLDIDNSAGTLMPFYDNDVGLLYLAGKGDGNVRVYELKQNNNEFYPVTDFKSNVANKGMAIVPKRSLDVMHCEIGRLLKLTNSAVEPISFFVPRKAAGFQADLYPDIPGDVPPHTDQQWLAGSNRLPNKVSLAPSGYIMTTLSSDKNHNNSNNSNATSKSSSPIRSLANSSSSNSNSSYNITSSILSPSPSKVGEWMQRKVSSSSPQRQEDIGTAAQRAELTEKLAKAKRRIFELETRLAKAGIKVL